MHTSTLLMLLVLLLGILGRSNIIAAAACALLLLKFTGLERFFPVLERRALEVGLICLVVSVLMPFTYGRVAPKEILRSFTDATGLIAILSGLLATLLNYQGLELLKRYPHMMIGMILGSIIGVAFFGGIPVGPLMAGGIAAVLVYLVETLR